MEFDYDILCKVLGDKARAAQVHASASYSISFDISTPQEAIEHYMKVLKMSLPEAIFTLEHEENYFYQDMFIEIFN